MGLITYNINKAIEEELDKNINKEEFDYMNDFWKSVKVVLYCLYFSPLIIGLLMIATGKKHDSNSPGDSWKEQKERYEREPNERIWQAQIHQHTLRYQNLPTVEPGSTPDDAYSEGYDEGYEQGRRDGADGQTHGYGYDDSTSYYGYYKTKYQEGYEEGYEEGYDEGYTLGQSEYEEKENLY